MTPYFKDMQVVDERLTAVEDKLETLIKIVIKLEENILCWTNTNHLLKNKKENSRM